MNVFINGKDKAGWAIDMIRKDLSAALKRLNINQTNNFLKADIIHNIWWNRFLDLKYFHLRFKKNIILTAVNFIDLENEDYKLKNHFFKVNKYVKVWLSPSTKQKKIIEKYHNNVFVLPYYTDLELFDYTKTQNKKNEILNKYNIPKNKIEEKVIIGSFQRDSEGKDLTKPKWQKGPELLVSLLKDLPKEKFILLLAGPRRHFLRNECKKHKIPYIFIGKETNDDDINLNNLPFSNMPELYELTDLYLVTSKSEGGPKAVVETCLMKKTIFSTDVGLASDFIEEKYIFKDISNYKKAVHNFVINFNDNDKQKEIQKNIEKQYQNCIKKVNYKTIDEKLLNIYENILKISH